MASSHLPPEILSFILNKCDSKTLCVTSLTSKEVAGLVSGTKHVKLQLPTHAVVGPDSVPVWPSGMLNFLLRFSCIDAVTLEFTPDGVPPHSQETLLRWCCTDSVFLLLHGNKLLNNTSVFKDFAVSVERDISDDLSSEIYAIFEGSVHHAKLYLRYVSDVIKIIPNLKTVTVEDPVGRLFVQEKAISEGNFKIPAVDETDSPFDNTVPSIVRIWWAPVLTVPGFLLQEVAVMTSQVITPKRVPVVPLMSEEIWNILCNVVVMKEDFAHLAGRFFGDYQFKPSSAAGN